MASEIVAINTTTAVARGPTSFVNHPKILISITHGEESEKYNGLNFRRWQKKVLFYLTTLGIAKFLTGDPLKLKEDETDSQVIIALDAWKHSEYLCCNYVINGVTDSLYNVYSAKKSAKELYGYLSIESTKLMMLGPKNLW